jgi:phosphoenolpyruvate carboxykinase (ATP)
MTTSTSPETFTLPGLNPLRARRNLSPAALYEEALRRTEGMVTDHGALSVVTTPHTGRSPNDKFVVHEPTSAAKIWWEKNARLDEAAFDRLHQQVVAHLEAQEVFVQDLFGGADQAYRLPVRFVTPNAWHALFVNNMFLRPGAADLAGFTPGFTVLHAPEFQADPAPSSRSTSPAA